MLFNVILCTRLQKTLLDALLKRSINVKIVKPPTAVCTADNSGRPGRLYPFGDCFVCYLLCDVLKRKRSQSIVNAVVSILKFRDTR